MMITYLGLISRAKMEDFNFRFGGITWPALEEFIQPDSLQVGDMIRRLPKARGFDSDSRYNRGALVAMSHALGIAAKEGLVASAPALIRAVSFYWPLVPQAGVFDDSGGRERAAVTVLSPQRCSHLSNCWQTSNARSKSPHKTKPPLPCGPFFLKIGQGSARWSTWQISPCRALHQKESGHD